MTDSGPPASARGATSRRAPFCKVKRGEAICARPARFGTRYIPGVFTFNSML